MPGEELNNPVAQAEALAFEQLYDLQPLNGGREGEAPCSFEGRWAATGQRVSVKVAAKPLDAQLKQAFDLLSSSASPALPDPVALLRDATGRLCLVSAWVEGQSLAVDVPRDQETLLSGFVQLARGLAQLHRRGLWHGDPSLANVVLAPDGQMSWIDFGLLGHHGGGTPGFLAPETLRGEGGAAADVFGLGCLIGRMWTGVLPFPDLDGLRRWVGDTSLPVAWTQLEDKIPDALAKLVGAMLHPEPAQRPSIEDVVVELELVRTTLGDAVESRCLWADPGRLPYLEPETLDRLTTQWSGMGPNADLLALCAEPGSGRQRTLEELAMRLEARGHQVERIHVPDLALAPSLLAARWLDCQEQERTLVVTGLDASTWIESLGGFDAFLSLRALASGRLVMPDIAPMSPSMPQRRDFVLGRWTRDAVNKVVRLYWPAQSHEGRQESARRDAWSAWLHQQFQGRAGDTVRELGRIAASQAKDPAGWRWVEHSEELPDATQGWSLASLCRAGRAAVIDQNASLWQSWPAPDQLTLALAWSKAKWPIRPAHARVLMSALLAQGLHELVLDESLAQGPGALFVRARTVQASQGSQASAPLIEQLIKNENPSARVAGLALQLRARIEEGRVDASLLEVPPDFEGAERWARAWWRLWSGYAKLGGDPARGLEELRALTLETAGLNVVERAPVLARASQVLGNHAWERGRRTQAFTYYQECTDWFCAGGESVGEAMAAGNIAALAFSGGELSRALKCAERAIGALLALDAWQPLGVLITNHIRLLGLLKRTRRAQALYDRARAKVSPDSIDAARLLLAIGYAKETPVTPQCVQALNQLEGKVPAREMADAAITVAARALMHEQPEKARALLGGLASVDASELPHLGVWAQVLASEISGQSLSFAFWEHAHGLWTKLAQSESPIVDLAWSHRLLQLHARRGEGWGAPAWLAQRGGFDELLARVVESAPYSDKDTLNKRFAVELRSRSAQSASPRLARTAPPKSAPAFGDWGPLLASLERWAQCKDLEQLKDGLLTAALDWAQAERGMLVIRDTQGQSVAAREYGSRVPSLATSRTIVEGVFAQGEGVVTIDARSDERFGHAPSVTHLNLRSVLAAPLRGIDGVFGVIYLDARMRRGAFGEEHLVSLEHFARVASLLWQQSKQRFELERTLDGSRGECQGLRERLEQRELEGLRMREQQRNRPVGGGTDYFGLIGGSVRMAKLTQLIDRYAQADAPVVVIGEQGTGKKSAVKALHAAGPGEQSPLVMQDLSLLPGALARDLLFGGPQAPAGASLFEVAAGGILYLEGLDALDEALQKDLRVRLEDDKQPLPARLVVGMTQDPQAQVQAGVLRQDLVYRLCVLRLEIPALRQRLEDLPEFVHRWLSARGRSDLGVSAAAMRALSRYAWPGNLRELEQEVARLSVLCESRVEKEDLSAWILSADREGGKDPDDLRLRPRVEALEREIVARALERSQGNQSHAATLLGLSRFGLQKKLRRWAQEEKEAGT